ncbi:insulinase family protein [Anaeromicropila populeti]|uniref:Peptidase M16C associated domain-containing protein n=1 Tax=Anaeromicropila populeti TaxID=37658 RepID=A0A1I6JA41_9FIRM|nr:insulinase family protein [Anaeromicropila populeti]SFR75798.1 hypothetical protein SAMN05661086_01495 [Anaeromicropila populeti]
MSKTIKNSSELNALPAYELVTEQYIEDLKSLGLVLKHKKTGARIVILSNDDENKVFSIGFRTPPEDSTGVAHIVEHTVLCGSNEFPSKDPFVELAKGSLNTFLNAMTFSDKTIYPIASCNDKDYQNLIHVYMDAVFYPNIYSKKQIFQQEGWNYEYDQETGALKYNGVVYNEMKGVFSSPEQQLYRLIQQSLFPDTTYGTESGGDPEYIVDLTYNDFLAFHKKYYHPSNSYIYLYGDLDIEEKLTWMDEKYLGNFTAAPVDSGIKQHEAFTETREVVDYYSISEMEQNQAGTYLSYNIVVGDNLDSKLYLAFQVLEYALITAPGAPLKQALIDAGIGKDILSNYENDILQPYLAIIAKEANEDQKDSFVKVIKDTCKQIVEKGISEKAILAAINNFEFKYREGDYGSYPKGLMYGIQILDSWLYDDSKPFIHLDAGETFEFLKQQVKEGYFEKLIEKYVINNTYTSLVIVKPKVGMTAEMEAKTADRLARFKASLSEEALEQIKEENRLLRIFQETPSTQEELEKIPLLSREDIGKQIQPILNEKYTILDVPVLHHNYTTNGIGYLRIGFSIDDYVGYAEYLGLLGFILGKVSTKRYNYQELSNEINIHTGGIVVDVESYDKNSPDEFKPYFEIRVKTLYGEMESAFELVKEILFDSILDDDKRIKEIVSEVKSKMRIRMNGNGHSLAAGRALAYTSKSARFTDKLVGLDFYHFLKDLEENMEERIENLRTVLKGLVNSIFAKENMIFGITADESGLEVFQKTAENFVKSIEEQAGKIFDKESGSAEKKPVIEDFAVVNEGIKTAGQVQYVAKAGNYACENMQYDSALKVLKTILSYEYLWVNIRVKGGAYGSMCSFMRNTNCYFVSYRDPNLSETLAVYDSVYEFVKSFQIEDRDMTKYVLGTISMMDTPLNPSAKGTRAYSCYMSEITEEQLQEERNSVIQANAEDIRKLADRIKVVLEKGNICVVGNESKIEACSELFGSTQNL